MTEVHDETILEQVRPARPDHLGAVALQAARELTAVALGKGPDEVSIAEIAITFTKQGFSEWPPETAQAVRNLLASEYGFDHL